MNVAQVLSLTYFLLCLLLTLLSKVNRSHLYPKSWPLLLKATFYLREKRNIMLLALGRISSPPWQTSNTGICLTLQTENIIKTAPSASKNGLQGGSIKYQTSRSKPLLAAPTSESSPQRILLAYRPNTKIISQKVISFRKVKLNQL